MPQKLRSWTCWLPVLLIVVALLIPLPNEYRADWVSRLLDLGHLPLFALLTVCLWHAFGRNVAAAFLVSVAAAGVMEVCQWPLGRNPSLMDFTFGVLGGLLGVVGIRVAQPPRTRRRIAGHVVLAIGVAAGPVFLTGPVVWDAYRAYRSFPLLCGFATPQELHRWHSTDVTLEHVNTTPFGNRPAGRMDFPAAPEGDRDVILFPVVRDWSGYREFCIDFAFEGRPIRLSLSIRDGRKIRTSQERHELDCTYPPGEHHVCIDLQALAAGKKFAPVDVTRVQSVHLIVKQSPRPRTLYVDRVSLR